MADITIGEPDETIAYYQKRIQELEEDLSLAELDYTKACLEATIGVHETREETARQCLDIIRNSLNHDTTLKGAGHLSDRCSCEGCTRSLFLIKKIEQKFSLNP